ncbi:MAG: hypothetical protein QOJ94_1016 [Sphingomonadales bacterium]|jgi:serine/threonine protein kinase|nr:hypothetical protein [Sphingomonadales bacterium]
MRVGERIDDYVLVQNPKFEDEADVRPIGSGGTSKVYLVQQTLVEGRSIHRALKLFDPTDEVRSKRAAAGASYGSRHFLDEIEAISTITHQNIVKIIDAGMLADRPFFVMEYIDGPTLEDSLEVDGDVPEGAIALRTAARNDPFLVIRLAQQICWPLAYLHARRRFHFDLAPKNVFVRWVDDKPHVIIGDLGVSRHVPVPDDELSGSEEVFIAGTKEYTPPALESYRAKNAIPLATLAPLAAHWDLYALGKVILRICVSWELASSRELEPLLILCERLMTDTTFAATEAASELERLLPVHVLTAGVEELSTDAFGHRKYRTVPLGAVPMTKRVNAVVDHPAITRLQLVPQLLLYRSATPGGVHTVFEHLIGSYGTALRCLTKLLSEPRFIAAFPRKNLEEALLTVLLSRLDKHPLDRVLMLVQPYKAGERREFFEQALHSHRGSTLSLADTVLTRFPNADLESVLDILCLPATELKPYQKLIASLLDSSINVHSMDYLIRDSFHTGISAGRGIDVSSIIESLRWSEASGRVGISLSGVFSLEHLLCARYWMFARLYWNHINRSITAMLRHVVYDVLREPGAKSLLSRSLLTVDEAGALQKLNEMWSLTGGFSRDASPIIDLLRRPRPRPYFRLFDKFAKSWGSDPAASRAAIDKAGQLNAAGLEALRQDFLKQSSFANEDPSLILFDVPQMEDARLGQDVKVLIRPGVEIDLSEASDIAAGLPLAFHETCVRLRAFCHPELSRERTAKLRDEASAFLDERFLDKAA